MAKPINDMAVMAWLSLSIVFMLLMFDRDFGNIYIAICFAALVFFLKDLLFGNRVTSFPIERNVNTRWLEMFIGVAGYAIFLVVTSFITRLFSSQAVTSASLVDIIRTMSTDIYQATTPILRDSTILMIIGWGLMIPIAETLLFNGKVFEALHDLLKRKSTIAMIIICLVIGAGAALYHLSSKSGSSVALMITFSFFTLSAFMVWWRKDLRAAIVMHIIANTIAVGFPLIQS